MIVNYQQIIKYKPRNGWLLARLVLGGGVKGVGAFNRTKCKMQLLLLLQQYKQCLVASVLSCFLGWKVRFWKNHQNLSNFDKFIALLKLKKFLKFSQIYKIMPIQGLTVVYLLGEHDHLGGGELGDSARDQDSTSKPASRDYDYW